MAILCRKLRLLFIMTPRTACTAVGNLLLAEYGGEYLPENDIVDDRGRITVQRKHSTLAQILEHQLLSPTDARDYLKFAAVRNPFDSLVSLYIKQRTKYQPLLQDPDSWVNRQPAYAATMKYACTHSFKAWLFRKCRKQMVKRLMGIPPSMFLEYTSGADRIIRYESIEAELGSVLAEAGVAGEVKLPMSNRTEERTTEDYRTWYSRSAALAVRLAFSDDLKNYGYQFQGTEIL